MSFVKVQNYSDTEDTANFGNGKQSGSSATANTDILTDNYTVRRRPCVLRIWVTVDTAAVLSVIVTDMAGDHTHKLNGGTQLSANCQYNFTFGVDGKRDGELYEVNFQFDQNCTITSFSFDEINEAA
nr:hypothetical protein [uncultured Nitrososphaera sp.]